MGYQSIKNHGVEFYVDWDIVQRIIRSYWTAQQQLANSSIISVSESQWYNPMSWAMPDVWQVDVDWKRVRNNVELNTDGDLRDLQGRSKHEMANVAYQLDSMVKKTGEKKEQFLDLLGDVQTGNVTRIEESVAHYEGATELLKFVRDSSATAFMIGASVMTGGAGAAAMGAGSIFKGTIRYQDSGSVGAAAMEAAGSFVFAFVKLEGTLKQTCVVAVVQGTWAGGTEVVAGKTLKDAAHAGAVEIAGTGAAKFFKLAPMQKVFEKVAVPIRISYNGENKAKEILEATAAQLAKGGFSVATEGSKQPKTSTDTKNKSGPLVRDTTLANKFLLQCGVVNMQKGIGRGW